MTVWFLYQFWKIYCQLLSTFCRTFVVLIISFALKHTCYESLKACLIHSFWDSHKSCCNREIISCDLLVTKISIMWIYDMYHKNVRTKGHESTEHLVSFESVTTLACKWRTYNEPTAHRGTVIHFILLSARNIRISPRFIIIITAAIIIIIISLNS